MHTTRKTKFCLCINDFGVKRHKEDIHHLINTLQTYYQITINWAGTDYCGISIELNYDAGHVDISMPDYMFERLSTNSTIPRHKNHNMHRINGQCQHIQKLRNLFNTMNHHHNHPKDRKEFNPSSETSYIMHGPSTSRYCWQSTI